jgi:4-hydroxy-tetrahydrodipicolinate reductase
MNIALLGYGKMGREIESVAVERGHQISLKVTDENSDYTREALADSDVAIEFSIPAAAVENIRKSFAANVPVVVGTTGWYDQYETIKQDCLAGNNALLTATNFSIGVNIFFEINEKLATLMNQQKQYETKVDEIHHTQKLDAPSGTAITIAEGIIEGLDSKESWVNAASNQSEELEIHSFREENVPGTHTVTYQSLVDEIEIKHTARSRKGFALGAVMAAEWIATQSGVFTMKDMLKL